MQNLTAILQRGEPHAGGFRVTCLQTPGAKGHGAIWEECLRDLAAALELVLEVNEEEALLDDPDAVKTVPAVA